MTNAPPARPIKHRDHTPIDGGTPKDRQKALRDKRLLNPPSPTSFIDWVGERIVLLRRTPRELSRTADLSYTHFLQIVNGRIPITTTNFIQIARALEVPPKEVLMRFLGTTEAAERQKTAQVADHTQSPALARYDAYRRNLQLPPLSDSEYASLGRIYHDHRRIETPEDYHLIYTVLNRMTGGNT
jgi:hypothetical protein